MMFKKPPGVLMFLLVILKVLGTAEADCSCRSLYCDCSWQSLTSVPQDLPTNITRLNLGVNRITAISQSDLSHYESLENLHFGNNQISIISYQTFRHLSNLTTLNLLNNRLTNLRADMFTGLGNLEDLHLYHNYITDIQAGTFSPTLQLRWLHLFANKLTTLRSDMFTGLGNLEYLSLSYNEISDIQAGTFNLMPGLRKLYLNNNQIQSIPSNLLANLQQLTELKLSENAITTFPFEDLSKIQTISLLYLENNQMTTLPSMAYDVLSSISDVNIDNNPWQCDCRMVGFRLKMTGSRPFENQINCSHPDHLIGQKLVDINPDDLMSNCVEPTIVGFERVGNVALYHGDTLHLVCEASGIPTPEIVVVLPTGLNATSDVDDRVTVSITGLTITLAITKVTLADAGLYACIAASLVGSTSAITFVNIVYEEPTIVRFEQSEDNPLVEGETLHLVCEASGIPTPDITVILPFGVNATVESVGKVTVDVNGIITITDVTAADAGLYVCVATSPVGSKLATLYVDSFYKEPTILSFKRSENDLLAQGESLHLVCEASGIPTPDVTVRLPSGVNATVESVGRVTIDANGNIVIRNITAADAGLYGCIAANPAGFAFANLSINVIYQEPTIVRFERGDENILVEGKTPWLFCEASGIPTPDITVILPSGQNANSDSDVTLWVNGSTVVTVTTDNAGLYVCVASNTVGSTIATLYLDIKHRATTVTVMQTTSPLESNNYHELTTMFSLPVLLGAICGSVAGTALIGGIILAIWCKRNNQSPPKGPDFSVVFNNTNTTTTVITNGHNLTGQTQPQSTRPASSQFEPYEDVQPPLRDAVPSQSARGQALRPPNRSNNEPPPVPPPRTASATGYENIPEHAYQPLAVTRNQPDTFHHYQSLRRT